MTSDQQNPMRPEFEAWAKENLPRRLSLQMEEGDYTETETRIAFSAYRQGRRDGMDRAAVICDNLNAFDEDDPGSSAAAAIRAQIERKGE